MVRRRSLRTRNDRGAAAVEFALVVPVLLLIVFGIIDYGLYFSDSLAARSGVREGARQGVVQGCGSMSCLADLTKDRISSISSEKYVRIRVIRVAPNGGGWRVGNDLQICAMVRENGLTGLTPLPNDKMVRSEVRMRIEQDDLPPSSNNYTDIAPGGWSWCA